MAVARPRVICGGARRCAARVPLALFLVASVAQTGMAEPCAPRAELGGDAEAVAKVAIELQRLGVDASTDPLERSATTCPVIVAAVELDQSGGIAVAVRDASHRSEGRVVSDAALAAAWIDSWLRDDFVGPAVEPVPVSAPANIEPAVPIAETPVFERFMLTASYLQIWSDDGTWWSGFAASGCVRTNGFCVGGRFGYAQKDVTADLTAASKTDLSLLATISYSQHLGRMSIGPELGVGVGRLTTSRIDGCKPLMTPTNCDPMTDPMCPPAEPDPTTCSDPGGTMNGQVYVGDNFTQSTYTPRVSAALRVAIPLFEHVWLDGLAAATIAPFGHTDAYAAKAPDGTTMTDPNTMNTAGLYPLPGDATFGIQLGIGLRVGAP